MTLLRTPDAPGVLVRSLRSWRCQLGALRDRVNSEDFHGHRGGVLHAMLDARLKAETLPGLDVHSTFSLDHEIRFALQNVRDFHTRMRVPRGNHVWGNFSHRQNDRVIA